MAQKTYAALLKSKGDFEVSFTLPNSNKPKKFVWNKENAFTVEVPTEITYVDDHKNLQVFHKNYAKFLLDSYGQSAKNSKLKILEFVKELKKDEFEEKAFPEVSSDFPQEVKSDLDVAESTETKLKGNKNEKK